MASITRYATKSTQTNAALTKGAGNRPTQSLGENQTYWEDTFTVVAADWLITDVLRLGPFRPGEFLTDLWIRGDATGDGGDDVDIGWAYVDGTGTADPDAFFAGTRDMTATTIDVLGVTGLELVVKAEPPTNDRAWWLTVTLVDATGVTAGDIVFSATKVSLG